MHACRSESTLEAIIAATKSKRYTRTRIDRMIMCAFLGITLEMLQQEIPYIRVLAFREAGRQILSRFKKDIIFVNAGEDPGHSCWEVEKNCGRLYGLFAVEAPEAPMAEENRRMFYLK
jgi:hypothetical protein